MNGAAELRVGVVGAGGIARSRHLPNLRHLRGVHVVAVANRHFDRARAVAAEFDIPAVHADWADVVTSSQVDAVFVCTPPVLHADVTLAALENGKHVFCQARMAHDLETAMRMLDADRATSLTTALCPAPHYMTVDPHIRDLIWSQRSLGEIRHVVVQHAGDMFADAEQPLHWRQRVDVTGINILDVGIVAETLNKWFGPVTEVAAMADTWVTRRPADDEGRERVEAPDAVSVVGRFSTGATLTALFSGAVRGARPSISIHGSQGTLTCWSHDHRVQLALGHEEPVVYEVPPAEQGRWTVEADFLAAIERGVKGSPSFEEGALYTAFTHAVHEALQSGGRVPVPVLASQP